MQHQDLLKRIRVVDGDTVTGFCGPGDQYVRVRLHGIDAPEMDQPLGSEARNALYRMTGQACAMRIMSPNDRYGRVVATLSPIGGDPARSFNIQLVMEGLAYAAYLRDTNPEIARRYHDAQRSAQQARVGVWRDSPKGGIRPWVWRREHRRRPPHVRTRAILAIVLLLAAIIAALCAINGSMP